MIKARISEIFKSIQGEGKYAGVKQVFVRFYGCNMHCIWCDTPYAIGDADGRYVVCSPEELFDRIYHLGQDCHSVSLTGGEPLAQTEFIKDFLPLLKKAGLKIYLETNGIFYRELKEIIDAVDIIAMDIKLPSSTKCRAYWQEHEEFLKVAVGRDVFIKTVVSSDTSQEDILKAAQVVSRVNRGVTFILQPNFFEMKNGVIQKCMGFFDDCRPHLNDVRVLPQVHKFMKLR